MVFILVTLLSLLDISGYVESRPYLLWNDSLEVAGYSRGWLAADTKGDSYGADFALDLIVSYDTSFSVPADDIRIARLALWLGRESARITIGRQRLSWGVARVFRPLDVFNPANYLEPGYERFGVDAVLGYVALGQLSSFRCLFIPEHVMPRSFSAARIATNLVKNDIAATFMYRDAPRQMSLGGELAGEAVVGYWFEYRYTDENQRDFSMFSVGVDYTLPWRLYVMSEFFFDGSGVDDPSQYDVSLVVRGIRTTLAQRYCYASVSTVPTPFDLFRPSCGILVNIDDQGIAIIPQLFVQLFENTDITIGVNCFVGSAESEFKRVIPFNGAAYLWGKVYF